MAHITSLTIRFNVEARPFQHIRVEVTANLKKDDDREDCRKDLTEYARSVYQDIYDRVYQPPKQPDLPY